MMSTASKAIVEDEEDEDEEDEENDEDEESGILPLDDEEEDLELSR